MSRKMIGVTGSVEHLDILPDGDFLPPLKLRCCEHLVKRACAKMWESVYTYEEGSRPLGRMITGQPAITVATV
jgi:hypothetical protein